MFCVVPDALWRFVIAVHNAYMKQILFAGGILLLAGMAAFGSAMQANGQPKSDPSEMTMMLSGLGLVAVGLRRKPTVEARAN